MALSVAAPDQGPGDARLLRKQSTKAEDILWERLRGSRFHGAKFRRLVPFDRFVVDFYCHAAKLVVELGGKQHEWFADYGAERTKVLESRRVRVIRFTNAEPKAISTACSCGFTRR
jgi:very-short-patch-repair endonuclease